MLLGEEEILTKNKGEKSMLESSGAKTGMSPEMKNLLKKLTRNMKKPKIFGANIEEEISDISKEIVAFEEKPTSLTQAILIVLCNWHKNAELLFQKGVISKEEAFRDGKWLFQVGWLKEAIKNRFPELIRKAYWLNGEVDETRLRKSISAIMSQSRRIFAVRGFMKKLKEPRKMNCNYRIDSESGKFPLARLKKIYDLRIGFNGSREKETVAFFVVGGREEAFVLKKSFKILIKDQTIKISINGKVSIE